MKPFLDTGFLLTLLLETDGSPNAWKLVRTLEAPIPVPGLQRLAIEARFLRAIEEEAGELRELASGALEKLRHWHEELVFINQTLDYDIAFRLAEQWLRQATSPVPPLLILLWPALAATLSASHFLSFDPRTRRLAKAAGMQLLPAAL